MPTATATNEELLERYRRADLAGFKLFFERNHSFVLSFLTSLLGNRADAEDALQETFLRIHRHILSFDPSQPALGWVFAIARNVAIDTLRKRKRQPSSQSEIEVSSGIDAEAALEARHELARLTAKLSAEERLLLEQRFLGDVTFEELAVEQQTSPANVRQKLSRLLKKIKVTAAE